LLDEPIRRRQALTEQMTLTERIGGVLVRPRATLAALVASERGAGDLAILLGLRVVAGEAPLLARGVLAVPSLGPWALVRAIAQSVQAIVPELLALFGGGMLLALLAGRGARGRELELAGYAWVPYLAVTVVHALAATVLQRVPPRGEALAVTAIGAAWSAAVWWLAVVAARRAAPAVAS
jgi:hypothetical protein